ncbi:Clr5 domain-containing protein [Fusarium sp. Ph1]|nr:Clr5 domain-containing protein [Fusarium sp. Ph1]
MKWTYAARLLIWAGADVNKQCIKPSEILLGDAYSDWRWHINFPLIAAVDTGEVEFVEMLLDAGAKFNDQASRCLELAVQNRFIDIIQVLLHNGADPNQVGPDSEMTPLQSAVLEEMEEIDLRVVKIVIAAGADVNACSGGKYPLEIVYHKIFMWDENNQESGKYAKARNLLLQAGADPSLFSHEKVQHAARKGDIARVQSLILNGEDVNEPANDNCGATALQYAAMHGHLNMAMLLIENGARINAPGAKIHGRSALQGAAENGRLDMVHLLLEHDDEPDLLEERCHDAAKFAEKQGHRIIAQILREWKSS